MAITLALTRVLGKLFAYMHQPQVIGEIIAGIVLGPSVLGRIPGACADERLTRGMAIFSSSSPPTVFTETLCWGHSQQFGFCMRL